MLYPSRIVGRYYNLIKSQVINITHVEYLINDDKYTEMCPQCLYYADLLTLNKLFALFVKSQNMGVLSETGVTRVVRKHRT